MSSSTDAGMKWLQPPAVGMIEVVVAHEGNKRQERQRLVVVAHEEDNDFSGPKRRLRLSFDRQERQRSVLVSTDKKDENEF